MSVYGYCRISPAMRDSGYGLAEQERRIMAVAMYHGMGLDEVVSEVVSGIEFEFGQRPAAGALLGRLKKGDMLIIDRLDRAFRSALDALETARRLREAGVDFVVAEISMDPITGDGTGKLFFGMLALFAEFEASRLKEDTEMGRQGKRAAGGYLGGRTPFGYRRQGISRESALVEDPEQQRAIQWILEQGAAGVPSRKISKDLDERFNMKLSHVGVCRVINQARA